jgi:steroid delta-isomerase-like uncharacterized protein
MNSIETGHQLAHRFYDAINSSSMDDLDGVLAAGVKGHGGAGQDLAGVKQALGGFIEAFPDLVISPRHVVVEGDLVSTWVTYTGTHRGVFAGIPGTGREVRFAAWDLLRFKDGVVTELTQFCDLFTLLNQIGALPTTAPA